MNKPQFIKSTADRIAGKGKLARRAAREIGREAVRITVVKRNRGQSTKPGVRWAFVPNQPKGTP